MDTEKLAKLYRVVIQTIAVILILLSLLLLVGQLFISGIIGLLLGIFLFNAGRNITTEKLNAGEKSSKGTLQQAKEAYHEARRSEATSETPNGDNEEDVLEEIAQAIDEGRLEPEEAVEKYSSQLAQSVTEYGQIDTLRERLKEIESRANNQYDDLTALHHDIYNEAIDKAEDRLRDKTAAWFFEPTLDVDSIIPNEVLEAAYTVFKDKKKVNDFKKTHPQYKQDFWAISNEELQEADYEAPPKELPAIKEIQKILLSDRSAREKVDELNEVNDRYPDLTHEFPGDYDREGLSFGEGVLAVQLKNKGAPKPFELAKEGFLDEQDYLKLNPEEFGKRPGIGPKTVEKLRQFQQRIG